MTTTFKLVDPALAHEPRRPLSYAEWLAPMGMASWRQHCVDDLPLGESGKHMIVRDVISPMEFLRRLDPEALCSPAMQLQLVLGDCPFPRLLLPFTCTRLVERVADGFRVWMSDTYHEIVEHAELFERAHGRVLINGLGLGMASNALLKNPAVRSVTVIERCPDVIRLVAPHWRRAWGERLDVIEDDAFAYAERSQQRGERFEIVWHDIWPDISDANLPDMDRLEMLYDGRCEWQGSWVRSQCASMARTMRAVGRARKEPSFARRMPRLAPHVLERVRVALALGLV